MTAYASADMANSKLTRERPDIWLRAVELATTITGCLYVPKREGPDGTVSVCGYVPPYTPPPTPPLSDDARRQKRIREIENNIPVWDEAAKRYRREIAEREDWAKEQEKKIREGRAEIERLRQGGALAAPLVIPVPAGAMEWLLHEVGHYVVATPEERRLPNYGYGAEGKGIGKLREWQAWGFEEIVFGPWGPSRLFCPPSHRGGTAFSQNGPMPEWATRHAEREAGELRVDIDRWRALVGEWMRWNPGGWLSVN